MTKRSFGNGKTNRREFMTTAAALGASTALIGGLSEAKMQLEMSARGVAAARVGISNTAYQKAWKRAAAMVVKMTLDEKISQTGCFATAIKRLGIPAYNYYTGEALHGLVRGAPVTSFPLPLAMVCSWNPGLTRKVYTAVSDEARAYNNKERIGLSYFSPPVLNLHRDPRWGRCEEAPGEDPCLAGTWAVEVVRGMQGDDPNYLKTTACAKHFVCYNDDATCQTISVSVDPRSFWEYYTRAFRACLVHGDVFTFMSAYSSLNGIPCSADRFLLTSLLRRRWGFRGYVVSDCDAVYNIFGTHHYVPTLHQAAALAMQAGCDLNCGDTMPKHLGKAVADELVSEADISRAITRLLTARVLLGEFDPPKSVPYNTIGFDVVNSPAHQALALEAARQSIVLLKNDHQFLPLDQSVLKKVAVIGPMAGFHLGGYSGSPSIRISPLDGIAAAMGVEIPRQRVFAGDAVRLSPNLQMQDSIPDGMDISSITNGSWAEFPRLNFTGKTEIVFRVASATRAGRIEVHLDRLNGPVATTVKVPRTDGWQDWTTVSTPLNSIVGRHRVFLRFVGGAGDLFNVKYFELLPPTALASPKAGKTQLIFEPGCSIDGPKDEKMFAAAMDVARQADVVVMICGVNQLVDREGVDRQYTTLSGVQHELIQACYKANPKTVLVLNTNNTVAINWEQENIPAIVAAIFAGQAQGTAIADVLFGNYNPGGKTCCTWYKSINQLPPIANFDILQGRTYMYFEGQPLYPFGYGLSYTTFQIHDLHINARELSEKKPVKIACTVKNTGTRAGAEVVQFYITVPKSPVKRPIKELVGFQRVELQPGESQRVTFTLPYTAQALWYWHESQRKFVLQPGTLKLMIGHSSADIDLTGEIHLKACTNASLGGPETLTAVAVNSEIVAKKV
ncbi:MAG: glycoside hydrolase family 3 C-terminal domain-containing protein [Planctomycetes bacterium]|nr:glycoside hydrolase family 3 C-terminal domain-containing protein [Planctomycetota bacterium]